MKVRNGVQRCFREAATALPIAGYIVAYPIFKAISMSKAMSERWYGLVFSIVYLWGAKPIHEIKEQLFQHLTQDNPDRQKPLKILEIGPGFGGNFKFYPSNTKLTTIEINNYLEKNIDTINRKYPNVDLVKSIIGNAEDMSDIPDNSIDVVIGTLVLCCIDKPDKALREIKRVLVPGGQFYFMESVQHPNHTFKYKVQQVYGPFWRGVTMRCKAGTFDALGLIKATGFSNIKLYNRTVGELPALLQKFAFGLAYK